MVSKQYTLLCTITESRKVMMNSFVDLDSLKRYAKAYYRIKDLSKLKQVDDDGYIWFVDGGVKIMKLEENKIFSDDQDVLEYKLDCSLDE